MKRKPNGAKYRNLTARSGVIYYARVIRGERARFSCQTNDWEVAAQVRDEFEQRKGIVTGGFFADVPRFGEFAQRYLDEDTGHLAPTTLHDRRGTLRPGMGPSIWNLCWTFPWK